MPHVLLTRAPLYSGIAPFLARLACVKRAASVDSEPGSNSRLNHLVKQTGSPLALQLGRLASTRSGRPGFKTQSLLTSSIFAFNQLSKNCAIQQAIRRKPAGTAPASKAVSERNILTRRRRIGVTFRGGRR